MSKLRGFNPFDSEINCCDPQIILNPRFAELVHQFGNYTINGEFFRYNLPADKVPLFPKWKVNPSFRGVTLNTLKDCYIIDFVSGEVYPVYFVVPCGHCIVCQNSKVSNFVRRCQYESMLYDSYPVHITLTYDKHHLPKDKSVSLRHIQLWKKRLRICLERSNYGEFRNGVWDSHPLRFCVAAEYGHKNTRRPHYHVIIWNYKPIGRFDYRFLKNMAWLCWYDENRYFKTDDGYVKRDVSPMCDWYRLTCYPINNDYVPKGCHKTLAEMNKTSMQAFGYVAKYFFKEDAADVPPGRAPLFHTMSKSKGLGGIGAPFIDQHADELRKNFHKEYKYVDRDGNLSFMAYDRYLLNRVFPSRYTAVSYKMRKLFVFVARHVGMLRFDQRVLFGLTSGYYEKLFPVLPVDYNHQLCFRKNTRCKLVRPEFVQYVFDRYFSSLYDYFSSLDIEHVLSIENKRFLWLSKLYPQRKRINVHAVAIKLARYKMRRKEQFITL